jgi:hypothetical protein
VNRVIWDASVPVPTGELNRPVKGTERAVLVIASHTLGVKVDDGTVGLAKEISDAFEIPLVILATSHYLEKLARRITGWNGENRYHLAALDREDPVGDILQRLTEDDLLILTIMGSRQRFSDSGDRIPRLLLDKATCSVLVLHRP